MCCKIETTKLIEEVVNRIRQLPEAVRDEAAEMSVSLASKPAEPAHLGG
jgi:hypothetical protein